MQRINPLLKTDAVFDGLLELSDSAINGVIAVENPMPIDMAINRKLLPKETAASSAASELNIDEATFASEWPEMSGYSYYRIDLPAFDASNLSMYAKYRLELSTPANTPSMDKLVHACTKMKVDP